MSATRGLAVVVIYIKKKNPGFYARTPPLLSTYSFVAAVQIYSKRLKAQS